MPCPNASIFRPRHKKLWCGAVHTLSYHHHTIAAIRTPISENQSLEMEPAIDEEPYRRLVSDASAKLSVPATNTEGGIGNPALLVLPEMFPVL